MYCTVNGQHFRRDRKEGRKKKNSAVYVNAKLCDYIIKPKLQFFSFYILIFFSNEDMGHSENYREHMYWRKSITVEKVHLN